MMNKAHKSIVYLWGVYSIGILFFTLFRLLLFLTETGKLNSLPENETLSLILKAFLMGFRFDTVIASYILTLPYAVFLVVVLFQVENRSIYRAMQYYTAFCFLLGFAICAGNIPYFNQFYDHLTTVAFNWMDSPAFVFKMVIQEIKYWWVIIPFAAVAAVYLYLHRWMTQKILFSPPPPRYHTKTAYYTVHLLLLFLCLVILVIGIRGRLASKSPIRVGTAFFSTYSFPNKLGLNPVYTFLRSVLNDAKEKNRLVDYMDAEIAVKNVRGYLGLKNDGEFESPIARRITYTAPPQKANIILIIMESMSAVKLGRYGNPYGLTPNLDRMATQGFAFDNIYTAGCHTFAGVYGTLFAMPTLRRQHPMKKVTMEKHAGIGSTLRAHGYQTVYFTTHDDQFDNIGGFLRANDFERIISQQDYPPERVLSTLGVPDDFMYEFAIPIIDKLAQKDRPFLAAMMTGSDHGPYVIPEYFKPKHSEIKKQMVEYTDWSLNKLVRLASEKPWFANTIFVFIADHGIEGEPVYDVPVSYFHSPLIFYAPQLITEPRAFNCIGGQIDVFPTLMGILNLPYINNTLGIDLRRETRPFIYVNGDDKYGVFSHKYLLVVREQGGKSLYEYHTRDPFSYLKENQQVAGEMQRYAESMFQTAQWMVAHNITGNVEEKRK